MKKTHNSYKKITAFLASSKDSRLFNGALLVLIATFYVFRGYRYFLRPQLYAEDGAVWLSSGYNNGVRSIFHAYNGFSHLFDRLFGLFTSHLIPLRAEPIVYIMTALLIFLVVSYYFLSSRSALLTTNYQKLFFVLSLCIMGNAEEFYFSFSNSVFLLGSIGLLILVAKPTRSKALDIIERILFFILCFTIVFAWVYILILAFEFIWQRRRRYYYLACTAAGSIVQLAIHYSQPAGQRPDVPLRYLVSKATLFEFYNQIITPSLRFGRQDIDPVARTTTDLVFVCLALLLCAAIVIYVFWKSNYQTKCLLFFCLTMTLISLKSPVDGQTAPAAIVLTMATYHWGNRYFIFGILGMFLVWAKFSQQLLKKQVLAGFLVGFFIFGLLSSIRLGSFFIDRGLADLRSQYSQGITRFETTHQRVMIPINPDGGWYVILKPH